MVEILKSEGAAAGLYNYYEARVHGGCALSPYDRMVFDFALSHFSPDSRRVVHAGIGIGTLTSSLAVAGYHIAGIERDGPRMRVATRLREAIVDAWPPVAERYELLLGGFPEIVEGTPWMDTGTVLIFTNCGAGWNDELTTLVVSSLPRFGDVIFDARLFGRVRDSDVERRELVQQVKDQRLTVTPIAESPPNCFYHHASRPGSGST